MRKSITFKLWLTLSISLVLSLGTLLGLTYFSMHSRFVSFSLQAIEEHLPTLAQNISSEYQNAGHLNRFAKDNSLWPQTIYKSMPFTRIGPEPVNTATTESAQASLPTEVRIHDLRSSQPRLARALALYSPEKQRIAGGIQENRKLLWHKVRYNNQVIAYIAYQKPKSVIRKSEAIFLEQQLKFFAILSVFMLAAALFLAAFISRWFVRPLSQLSQSASQVAKGDFSARIDSDSQDELGQLCRHFDQMTEQLELQEHARRQWIADISHEMRTPVSVLKGQIEAIIDGIRPASPENISVLSVKVDSLNHLINDLFELALSDTGELSLEHIAINAEQWLNQFIEDNRDRAQQNGLSLTFKNTLLQPAVLLADRYRLDQVLHNLFENSLRYTDSPGTLLWTLSNRDGHIRVDIEDSFPGVPDSELNKVFQRLYRLEKSRNRATGGAGLGLALCRNIVHAHNGSIQASASALGGLKISLSLPIMEQT